MKNKTNNVSVYPFIAIFIVFIISMIFIAYYLFNSNITTNRYFKNYNSKIKNNLLEVLDNQKNIDNKINENIKDGGYTFSNPLILTNPYQLNPLSALVIFNTDEETSVNVSINHEYGTVMEKSKDHIIPIYGLFADALNYVELTLDDGSSKTLEFMMSSYNNITNGFLTKDYIGSSESFFILGDVNSNNSNLRGFDRNNNLNFIINLSYLDSITFYKERFAVGYNQVYDNNYKLHDIRLEMDYLGRIYSIGSNIDDLGYEVNLSSDDGVGYIGYPYDFYGEQTLNYSVNKLDNNEPYSIPIELNINSIENELTNASIYDKDYMISVNGPYISYDFKDSNGSLIFVCSDGNVLSYDLNNNGIIKTDLYGKLALYYKTNGVIYSLNKIIE